MMNRQKLAEQMGMINREFAIAITPPFHPSPVNKQTKEFQVYYGSESENADSLQ
jgi:hypothetical protein